MEQPSGLSRAFNDYDRALNSFARALQKDLSLYDEDTQDLLKNGQIQKFEYCCELAWKLGKRYLETELAILQVSPIGVYRELFLSNILSETSFQALRDTILDRNLLSHVYKETLFATIHEKLPAHLNTLQHYQQEITHKGNE